MAARSRAIRQGYRRTLVGSKPRVLQADLRLGDRLQTNPCGVEASRRVRMASAVSGYRRTLVGSKPGHASLRNRIGPRYRRTLVGSKPRPLRERPRERDRYRRTLVGSKRAVAAVVAVVAPVTDEPLWGRSVLREPSVFDAAGYRRTLVGSKLQARRQGRRRRQVTDEPLWGRSLRRIRDLATSVRLQTNPCGVEASERAKGFGPALTGYRRTLVGSKLLAVAVQRCVLECYRRTLVGSKQFDQRLARHRTGYRRTLVGSKPRRGPWGG